MSTVKPDALSEAFGRFEAAEAEARMMIEDTPRFRDRPDHRAQAYVCLAEARAMAYNHIIAPRLADPYVHSRTSWQTNFFSLGQNCPDFRYGALLLDGSSTYRLHGRVGDAVLVLLQINGRVFGHPDASDLGSHDLCELADSDGAFELIASASDSKVGSDSGSGPARLGLAPGGLNYVLIRRILTDVSGDPGEIYIERLNGPRPDETDADEIAQRFDDAAHFLRFLARDWCVGLYDMYIHGAGGKNRLWYTAGQEIASSVAGSASTTYGLGIWEIAPDEAMVIEWEIPDSAYWSLQLGDVWSNALDFLDHQTDVNLRTATLDPDGRLRAVIAHIDTGHANWLDTCGRSEGALASRNYRARGESPAPEVRVVALADLDRELPANTIKVTPEQRRAALAERRARFRVAYGD